jgi:hypothetical protein
LTIKSTSHTSQPADPPPQLQIRTRRLHGRRYFFALTKLNLCFVCPSIFNCQRSRLLLQQSVEPYEGSTNC